MIHFVDTSLYLATMMGPVWLIAITMPTPPRFTIRLAHKYISTIPLSKGFWFQSLREGHGSVFVRVVRMALHSTACSRSILVDDGGKKHIRTWGL